MAPFGRKSTSETARVFLNVYDLNEQSNEYLYPLGLGVYHSGVEIFGVEYTFASEAGIYEMSPKHAPPAKFRESIDLGPSPGSREVSNAIEELKHDFKGTDYHVLNRNCNHFADMFVQRLLNRSIPGYVNRLAGMGSMVSCLMPQALTGQAPVNDGASGGGGGGSGGRGGGSGMSSSSAPKAQAMPFGGAGNKLGLGAAAKETPAADGLNDRRERLRAAALQRSGQQ